MRIIHLTNAYAPHSGGVRTMVHALGRGYRQRGHELLLVVPGARRWVEDHEWGRLVRLPGPRVPGGGGYRVLAALAGSAACSPSSGRTGWRIPTG